MTIKMKDGTRRELSNAEALVMKRGCSIRMVYDIDKHAYAANGVRKYIPYVREK
jgi:hypothetical protein